MVIHLAAFWVCACRWVACWDWHRSLAAVARRRRRIGAQGFWIALIVGLTIAAVGLVLLLRRVARARLDA
jgi:MATE family multidrug resistance protein